VTYFGRLAAAAWLFTLALSAQTLQQAEQLRKQHNYDAANEAFRALVAQHPDNPEYRVRWGRMFLEHAQQDDIKNASDIESVMKNGVLYPAGTILAK
jgi:thioredoxin-like negative regulator of GroEL